MNSKDLLYEKLILIEELDNGWFGPRSVRPTDKVIGRAYEVVDDLGIIAARETSVGLLTDGSIIFERTTSSGVALTVSLDEPDGDVYYACLDDEAGDELKELIREYDRHEIVQFLDTESLPK